MNIWYPRLVRMAKERNYVSTNDVSDASNRALPVTIDATLTLFLPALGTVCKRYVGFENAGGFGIDLWPCGHGILCRRRMAVSSQHLDVS